MQIRCGQCGHEIELEDAPAGQTLSCPRCGHELYVGHLLAGAPRDPSEDDVHFDDESEQGYALELRRSLEQKIRFACGKCGKGLKVEKRFSGKRIHCPACKAQIRVPYPDAESKFEFAALPEDVEEVEIHVELNDVVGPRDDAVEMMAAGGRIPKQKFRVSKWSLLVAAIAVIWVALLAYWLISRMSDGETDTNAPSADGRIVDTLPASLPAVVTVPQPRTQPTSKPRPIIPAGLIVTKSRMSCFPGGRYFPARPQQLYLRVSVDVEAGSKPLRLKSFGRDVLFVSNEKEYPSLGLAISPSRASLSRARRRELQVAPGRRVALRFLFEVPMDTSSGDIRIRGVGETPSGQLLPPEVPAAQAIVGRYAELPPRSLQPLLRNPVMAAVQNARDHVIVIDRTPSGMRLRIPAPGVTGSLNATRRGHYNALLRLGHHKLKCVLRIIDGGEKLILYLSDEPFHQIVYKRMKAS